MRKHTIILYGTLGLAALAIGSTAVLWQSEDASAPAVAPGKHVASTSDALEYDPIRALIVPDDLSASAITPTPLLNLRMDNALSTTRNHAAPDKPQSLRELASRKTERSKASAPEKEPELKMPTPLNLRVPELEDSRELNHELADRNKDRVYKQEPTVVTPPPAFDLDGRPAPAAPKVASYSLFNPEYGLRGFMKQGWVSSTLGFQGGLGLNDGRRIQTEDDDLRDDIAVGMGVILAF